MLVLPTEGIHSHIYTMLAMSCTTHFRPQTIFLLAIAFLIQLESKGVLKKRQQHEHHVFVVGNK